MPFKIWRINDVVRYQSEITNRRIRERESAQEEEKSMTFSNKLLYNRYVE